MTYPALKGLTIIQNVAFSSFEASCSGGYNRVLMTSPNYGDIIHPVNLQNIQLENVAEQSKVEKVNMIDTDLYPLLSMK